MRHSTIGSMIGKRSRMTCFFFRQIENSFNDSCQDDNV